MDDNLIERRREAFERRFVFLIPEELEWCEVRKQYHGHHSWWIWTDKLQTWCAALDSAVVELPDVQAATDIAYFNADVVDAIERAGLRVKS
ncbi:hypothetical protein [Metapseudomonas otitidis]|uniref:hypothetical protein n=1 Tax=Metapseudomonas otitidis TaxID=319939 RepID=UPI002448E083|nr:hypothetical protein [Pseudomonas otitidis]MDG9785316.1 hypothetical protein [Pseudomonas otitidis]